MHTSRTSFDQKHQKPSHCEELDSRSPIYERGHDKLPTSPMTVVTECPFAKFQASGSLHHSAVFLLQDPDWQDDANCFFAVVFCLTGPSYKVAMTRWLRKHTLQPWVLQKLGTIETRQSPSRLPSQGVSRQRVPK